MMKIRGVIQGQWGEGGGGKALSCPSPFLGSSTGWGRRSGVSHPQSAEPVSSPMKLEAVGPWSLLPRECLSSEPGLDCILTPEEFLRAASATRVQSYSVFSGRGGA